VVVGRATVLISMFKRGMTGLNSLLREWEIAARDAVEIVIYLRHGKLSFSVR
jgi:hypothetical protein